MTGPVFAAASAILTLIGLVALLSVAVLSRVEAVEKQVRSERVLAEASWQIHRQATIAFAEMLNAARQTGRDNRQGQDDPA